MKILCVYEAPLLMGAQQCRTLNMVIVMHDKIKCDYHQRLVAIASSNTFRNITYMCVHVHACCEWLRFQCYVT